ncbi:MAG: adenylosuccinate lyase [Maribacter sp.]|nr:adenylosuccinate lyase [Maribacter sp.]
MTKEELYASMDYVNHSREKRKEMASLMKANPKLLRPLMEIVFEVNNPISCKASWVLEYSVKSNLTYILPHIDFFCENISRVQLDAAVRPMAKICEMLIKAYFLKNENETQAVLTARHLEQIAIACFDWLIGDHKVAAKAYSMTSLLLLGRKFDWIHTELKMVLEQNYASGSAAYKARARLTLAKLK